MATQSRGAPYPLGSDANNTAADIQALSLWVNDRPGVAALTTTQRNALTGVELWDGRVILNTTTDRLNRYDLGTTTWVAVADSSEVAALLATSGTPAQDGLTASRGVSAFAARADHVHPEPLWVAYTPTWSHVVGTGGSTSGRWVQHGKTIHFIASVVFGTGFTLASGASLSIPVARRAGVDSQVQCLFTDVGSANYTGIGYLNAINVSVWAPTANGVFASISYTVPFTWAAGDVITVSGTYEAA